MWIERNRLVPFSICVIVGMGRKNCPWIRGLSKSMYITPTLYYYCLHSHGTYNRRYIRTCCVRVKENRYIKYGLSRSSQMPWTDQQRLLLRTYFWVTILYKFHDQSRIFKYLVLDLPQAKIIQCPVIHELWKFPEKKRIY